MFDNNFSNRNQVNTNTTLITWYSSDSKLVIGGWNYKLSIDFVPCTGKDANGFNVYDKDRRLHTALSHENAETLYKKIKEKIVPHIIAEDDVEKSISVMTKGKDSTNLITVARKKTDDGMKMSITFYKGLGPDGKVEPSTQILTYPFAETEYMEDYDCNTGSGTEAKVPSQFYVFAAIIKKHISLIPVETHANRYSEAIVRSLSNKYGNSGPQMPSGAAPADNFMSSMEELPFGV